MELQNYLDLIDEASCVYEKYNTIKKQSGADFNIFEVINITRDENHFSSIIASLLNPNGSHMQGNRYLRLFLEILFDKKPFTFGNNFRIEDIMETAHVETEQFNTVQNAGGRIDIVIETHDYAIVIENKIDAGDQENQLWRYQQSKKNKKGTIVIYLTLDGRSPESTSKTLHSLDRKLSHLKNDEIVYFSYKDDILNWLEQCLIETPENISTIIHHFSQTVKKITNQEDNDMEKELALLLQNADKLKLADEITEAAKLARAQIEYEFFIKLKKQLDLKLEHYGFIQSTIPFVNEKIIWNWKAEKETIVNQIKATNAQQSGAVRLAYSNQREDVLFIADGYGLESFWYGFKSKNTIPKEIENYLSKNDSGVRWAYYPHVELPLWGDGIYTLALNMDEIVMNVVSDICENILPHTRVRQNESTATWKEPQYRGKKKLKNHIED